ncbi:hypothetical protein HJC23_000569 [Cyclotella cryptica]|uniref:Plastid lipid-associated protein/fibrillin conserved domain-containing protein n=1 Tax=Cyclotella cryptica TaxID=29204 RepID=A0ABD3PU07_9STRA|eukprot:CCRYP_011753-RA/>CCRYP_011753-RA protein AED:0.04 eAED:0.04 QI:217/1/1/1/1/1/2/293/310
MRLSKSAVFSLISVGYGAAFAPCLPQGNGRQRQACPTVLEGYLDNLSAELNAPDSSPEPETESREATKMAKDQIQSYGPGSFEGFVDFSNEFDGGDGQMGVAGDGNNKLERMDAVPQLATSKMMSAKNAWGTSTGYADSLRSQNPKMDTARAQQLENWANQREVRAKNLQLKQMSDSFDQVQTSAEEDWRQLAKFGVERNDNFDLDETFGPVTPGNTIDGVIELVTAVNRVATYDLMLRNPFMGFADFRAAFTSDTPMDWSVEPTQGSLKQKEDTHFVVKFKPQGPGGTQGYLVIETEDFKKTYQVVGST